MERNIYESDDARYAHVGLGNGIIVSMYPHIRTVYNGKRVTRLVQFYVEFEIDGTYSRFPHSMSRERADIRLAEVGIDVNSLRWERVEVEATDKSPWNISRDKRSGIYFIEAEGTGLVKIGYGKPVQWRYQTLRAASPYPLKLLLIIDGDRSTERKYHQQFKKYHHHNEWFRIEGELVDFIAAHR